jgi:tRNA-specific adenosine deaminase 3
MSRIEAGRHDLAVQQPCLPARSLVVRRTETAGRGVFAQVDLTVGTLVDISHVLLFPAEQYAAYGKFTELDNYTYVWQKTAKGPIMALALGTGSLFNHSSTPNVSFFLDKEAQLIRYTIMRSVRAGEELCISYGTGRMWWEERQPLEADQPSEEGDGLPFLWNDSDTDVSS